MGRSISYIGDCKRFSSAKQAAYYAGLFRELTFLETRFDTEES
ncbi:transposase, IS116/IS110/IS902 domain protein [Leptospira interrogans str. UI 12621]|uniref:Transposase, IS116/IS110/IS902 domain protein n=1 Tax=Leptospira interrogans str. UI 12621 TaxID=1049937 RepID=A0A0F6H8N7_LEPIR|nr:transposase, IS116/IS110/IS902 domain protein [Leptospira interrogans str. UI 12621]